MADPWYNGPWQKLRPQIYQRDGGICQICTRPVPPHNYHIDHITPIARGGQWWNPNNLRLTHPTCNTTRPHPKTHTHTTPSRPW